MHFLSQADLNFLLKFKNQWGLFPTSLNEPISINRAGFTTSAREEKSRELLHWRKLTWRGEGKGEQLAQQQGQTFVLATPDKSSGKQKDKKMKEAGLFLSKISLLPWACTASREAAGMQTWHESYHRVNHLAAEHQFAWTHTEWTYTIYSLDTYENVWKSILLGGSLNYGEQKKKPVRQCKCHCCFWKLFLLLLLLMIRWSPLLWTLHSQLVCCSL